MSTLEGLSVDDGSDSKLAAKGCDYALREVKRFAKILLRNLSVLLQTRKCLIPNGCSLDTFGP